MDHRGTVYAVTDQNQATQLSYTMDAFGRQLAGIGGAQPTVPNDLIYQSNWFTLQIGGRWYGISKYRIYDFELGIFLSRDFLRYLNKYRAWSNNPVGQVDRDGRADVEVKTPDPEEHEVTLKEDELNQPVGKKPGPDDWVGNKSATQLPKKTQYGRTRTFYDIEVEKLIQGGSWVTPGGKCCWRTKSVTVRFEIYFLAVGTYKYVKKFEFKTHNEISLAEQALIKLHEYHHVNDTQEIVRAWAKKESENSVHSVQLSGDETCDKVIDDWIKGQIGKIESEAQEKSKKYHESTSDINRHLPPVYEPTPPDSSSGGFTPTGSSSPGRGSGSSGPGASRSKSEESYPSLGGIGPP